MKNKIISTDVSDSPIPLGVEDDGKKDRKFCGILYPDSESYNCEDVLLHLYDYFQEAAYILHDKDLEDGKPKKPHYHWVGRLRYGVTLETIQRKLSVFGVSGNFVRKCKSFKGAVRYLIHADDIDKFQYSVDSVTTSFNLDKYLDSVSAEDMASSILAEIIENGNTNTVSLCKWSIDNGYWSEFRRGFAVWQVIINDMRCLKYES